MKVRNNTNSDFELAFSNGTSIRLSRGETTRELTEKEITDVLFAKALKKRSVVPFKKKLVVKPVVKPVEKKIEIPKEKKVEKTSFKKKPVKKKEEKED